MLSNSTVGKINVSCAFQSKTTKEGQGVAQRLVIWPACTGPVFHPWHPPQIQKIRELDWRCGSSGKVPAL
jgi:hypothetical protein